VEQPAEKVIYFVIPSAARNLSTVSIQEEQERFLTSFGMTKGWDAFSVSVEARSTTGFPTFGRHRHANTR
jgi:hypothetical protein